MTDYFLVLDTDNTQLVKRCGGTAPNKVISSGNKLTVVFHSDNSENMKGFKATWRQVSAAETGTIKTKNYPLTYPNADDQVEIILKWYDVTGQIASARQSCEIRP